ncbi:MAG: Gamma-D-glutamyl-L-diamino acid endopeptidase 1 [Firmicutes bacterium ADurb.Bin193]|nr:MAG: Gamma-D-glutamyl-L-diamino acid endopeptidase 1 [Firmicutes bacterium ADurb.Bin193]
MEDKVYDYTAVSRDLRALTDRYPFVKSEIIGKSLKRRNIYLIRLGEGERQVFYNAAHHGTEWITAKLMMRFAFDFAESYVKGYRLAGYDIRRLYRDASIYIAPMVNPDGVELSKTKEGWQANARGVDLNHNYDAGWDEYKKLARENGITAPGRTRYAGRRPESEPESKAIADFTRRMDFEYVVAFHSQGEVIYWKYGKILPPRSEEIARLISKSSGYELDEADGLASYSGYKDWFIKEFGRPGYTIEVGAGENPLPLSQFEKIYKDILEILVFVGLT